MSSAGAASSAGSTLPPPSASTVAALAEGEWPAKVADLIEEVVGRVHDQVVRPIILAGRGLVFGLVIATFALAAAVLGAVALVRVLDVYAFANRVWASDAVIGAVFTAAGLFAWSRRRASSEER